MDSGATFHLHSNNGLLNFISYKNIPSSCVFFGDGSKMPIQKIGSSIIPQSNPYFTLTLITIFITVFVIKILISVRPFTRDNKCSIEFDFFFFVKEYHAKETFLRCERKGYIYLIATTLPQALTTITPSSWH